MDPIEQLHEIVNGIDETESDAGWWETGSGADFGSRKLSELEALVRSLV